VRLIIPRLEKPRPGGPAVGSRRDLLWERGIANQIFRRACLTAAIKNRRPTPSPFAPLRGAFQLFSLNAVRLQRRSATSTVYIETSECFIVNAARWGDPGARALRWFKWDFLSEPAERTGRFDARLQWSVNFVVIGLRSDERPPAIEAWRSDCSSCISEGRNKLSRSLDYFRACGVKSFLWLCNEIAGAIGFMFIAFTLTPRKRPLVQVRETSETRNVISRKGKIVLTKRHAKECSEGKKVQSRSKLSSPRNQDCFLARLHRALPDDLIWWELTS